ncbi:MAG: carbohydrate ABC transporter substrate-binding protein [Oscillospiraceae bacterium]|nr:carbohydrate ABC transporter substrate-binding protein [Oscillospiraceae bacterium]
MKRLTAAVTACAMLLCSGCTSAQVVQSRKVRKEITLSWWGNDARNEYTLAAVQEFEALYPEIKVNCSYSEWSGYEARSRVRMISDTEADVMQVNFSWLSEYSPDGTGYYDLEQLDPDKLDLTVFTDNALSYGRMNGTLNAVPIAMNAQTVYINKTVYDSYGLALPETWDELFAAAKVMQKDGVYPISCGSKSMWLYLIAYAEQSSGRRFLDENGKLGFTKDDFQCMIEMYVRLIGENVTPQVEYYERLNLGDGTYAGTVAWVSDAVNYMGDAIANGYEIIPVNYTALTPERSGEGWYAKPATMYAVSKNTEHPEESALLLDFLLNSEEMAMLQGVEKGIPLSSAAREVLEGENMLQGVQYDASQKMESYEDLGEMQPLLENSALIDLFVEDCNKALYEKADAAAAAAEVYHAYREAG